MVAEGFWEVEGLYGVNGLGRLENRLGVRMRNYDWVDGGVLADSRVVVV